MYKFPIPNRKKNFNGDEHHREINQGSILVFLDDGRPALIERWYDCDTELDLMTVLYSSMEIEDWSSSQHAEYLVRNGILKELRSDIAINKWLDAAKQSMWSLNFVKLD
jgi:hypothetical protein